MPEFKINVNLEKRKEDPPSPTFGTTSNNLQLPNNYSKAEKKNLKGI